MARLKDDGVLFVDSGEGDLACGEVGKGRMAEPAAILEAIEAFFRAGRPEGVPRPLAGLHALVTSGPTHEPIDPVRYIANRSSGAQGTALARALTGLGAQVVFVTGPASVPRPGGCAVIEVETAQQMLEAVEKALPADAAIFAAAVADWKVQTASASKIKKGKTGVPVLDLTANPDILAAVAQRTRQRPGLVIGFAAETGDLVANATAKRTRKGCDWIVANDVSPGTGIMGGTENAVTLITEAGAEPWPRLSKTATAERLVDRVAAALA
jgi:phosphopantothenoylcysteine decarboxylase/phosphopantothenate--cysteine ligase